MEQLEEVLDPRLIRLNLQASSKRDAITQLSETRDGIAIPHGKSDYVTKVGVAIGILNKPISWETLDGEGVNIVILFAVSNDTESARNQLKLLSLFAAQLGHDDVVKRLKHAATPDAVFAAFTQKEGSEQ